MLPEVNGYADDVTTYDYDLEMAKKTLQDAGYTLPVEIEFWYPTDVSRPYMPDSEAELRGLPGEPEQVGLQGDAEERPWNPGLPRRADCWHRRRTSVHQLDGRLRHADNFIGTFFQSPQRAWGTTTTPLTEIQNLLNEGEEETDEAKRQEIAENANRAIMEQLPGVPRRTRLALAFDADVKGYVASPTTNESFAPVTLGG